MVAVLLRMVVRCLSMGDVEGVSEASLALQDFSLRWARRDISLSLRLGEA